MNRKESGSGAGPYRPCLRRESQAITHREIPCQALHSLSQAKAKAQLPLPGTAQGALAEAGRRGGSTSCFPALRQQRSRTGTREEQALPARTSTGTDMGSQRDGKNRHVPLGGALQGPAALLASRAHLHNMAQNKLGANRCMGWGPGSRRAATTALRLSEQTRVQPSAAGAAPDLGMARLQVAGRGSRRSTAQHPWPGPSPQRGSHDTQH